jgi:hypothetical protein
MRNKTLKYYYLLIFTSIIVAFPSTYIYYFSPIFIVLYSIHNNMLVNFQKLLSIIIFVLLFSISSLVFNGIIGYENNSVSLLYGLITYSSFLILLSLKYKDLINNYEINYIVKYLSYFVIVQSLIVFFQMTQTWNWDALSGTFGLFDYMGRITISQVMFTFNTYVIMLFLLPYGKRKIVKVALVLGLISTSAAQSGHQFIFLIFIGLLVYASFKDRKLLFKTIIISFGAIIIVLFFFPSTIDLAIAWFQNIVFGNYPKALVTIDAIELLYEDFKVAFIGTGLGQFTSRASLFSSGDYLGVNIPEMLTSKSSFYVDIVEPKLELQEQIGEGSAIAKPYYSVLSLLIEFGVIIFGIIVYYTFRFYRKNKKYSLSKNLEVASLSKFMNAFILFLIMCSFIENYLEFIQAITLPILLFYISISRRNYILTKKTKFNLYKKNIRINYD